MDPHVHELLNYQSMVFDDAADEFEVAEERANLFGENVNAEILSYEQLLELQERIGFVNRGMRVEEMKKFPQMVRSNLKKYFKLKKRKDNRDIRVAVAREVRDYDLEDAAPEEHHP